MPRNSATAAAATRRSIIDAVTAAASVQGFSNVSTRAIARDLHLSSAGTLGPFTSREALLREAIDNALNGFRAAVIIPTEQQPPGLVRLNTLIELWVDYLVACPYPGGCIVTAGSIDLDGQPGALRDRFAADVRRWREFLAQQFRAAGVSPVAATDAAVELIGLGMAINQEIQLLDRPPKETTARGRRLMRGVIERHGPA